MEHGTTNTPYIYSTPHQAIGHIPDQDDTILCFSDAAWRKEDNMAGFGCSFKDKEGHTLHQGTRTEKNVSSPLAAEALALRWTIFTAHAAFQNSVSRDCQSLLVAISSKDPPADLYRIEKSLFKFLLSFL